jgi:lysophospholipase L1-like esterase
MFRRMKKLTSTFIVALMLVFAFAPGASAATYGPSGTVNYVALGDSVAVGMSSPNNYGYTTMYRDYLKLRYKTVNYTNLAYDGATSEQIKNILSEAVANYPSGLDNLNGCLKYYTDQEKTNGEILAPLASADKITINLGGLDVWGPFMMAAFKLYTPYPENNDLTTNCSLLYKGIKGDSNPLAKYSSLNNQTVNGALWYQADQFEANWQVIMRLIRQINSGATVYVNSMYSPMPAGDPLYYTMVKPLVEKMNASIYNYSDDYNYKVVNVNQSLKATGAVSYNVKAAILIAKYNQLNNYSLQAFMKSLDFHPTFYGHTIIFNKLINTQ